MMLGCPLLNAAARKREEMVQKVVTSDYVQFYWLITTADFEIDESEVHAALLKK